MRVERFTDWNQLEPLRTAWNQLAGGIPFRRFEWLMPWWRHFGRDQSLYVLGVFDEEELIGVAPWYRSAGTAGGWSIRFLGDGDVCSDYLDLMVQPGREYQVTSLLADWLHHALHDGASSWDALDWRNLEAANTVVRQMTARLSGQQAIVHCSPATNCWRLELPGTWREFEMVQSKSHRKQVRRMINRVLDSPRAALHVADNLENIDEAMEILVSLHTRRRQSLNQGGCFSCQRFRDFLWSAARELIAGGLCEVLWLSLDGAPVAAEIHLLSGRISYAYQAGIDPDRLKEQPGSLMQAAVIRRAIEQQKTTLDFLRGDEPYKAHWRAQPLSCENIRVIPNTTSGLIRHGIWATQLQVKSWFRTGLSKARSK